MPFGDLIKVMQEMIYEHPKKDLLVGIQELIKQDPLKVQQFMQAFINVFKQILAQYANC